MTEFVQQFLRHTSSLSILVIGDIILDRYVIGEVNRISPEAPIPIVDVKSETAKLGGAANVVMNLASLGASPTLCGIIGNDFDGETLLQLSEASGFDTSFIFRSTSKRTIVKTRILANGQQLLRIDQEKIGTPLDHEIRNMMDNILQCISSFDAIIIQDYDKFCLSPSFISRIQQTATQYGIPLTIDPKKKHFHDFEGAAIFKPNLKEFNEGLGISLQKTDLQTIAHKASCFMQKQCHQYMLVTLNDHGMLLVDQEGIYRHFPAHYRNISDVSGAGDTVISIMTLGLAAGLAIDQTTKIANLAGGLVCEEQGIIPITPTKLLAEAKKSFAQPNHLNVNKV